MLAASLQTRLPVPHQGRPGARQDPGRGGEGTTFLIATRFSKSQEQAPPPAGVLADGAGYMLSPYPLGVTKPCPRPAAASRDTPGQGASRGNGPSSSHPPAPASAPFPPPTSKETPTLGPPGLQGGAPHPTPQPLIAQVLSDFQRLLRGWSQTTHSFLFPTAALYLSGSEGRLEASPDPLHPSLSKPGQTQPG